MGFDDRGVFMCYDEQVSKEYNISLNQYNDEHLLHFQPTLTIYKENVV